MVRIAVLDDQEEDIELVSCVTKRSMDEIGIPYELKTYKNENSLLDDLKQGITYDIFLLDVEMKNLTGIEVAREIRKKDFEAIIIYITNYVDYAVEAYEVNAYRYIPKRLLREKLPETYQTLAVMLEEKWQDCFIIEKNHQLERIPYNKIYYLKKEGKNTLIVHKNGTASVRKPISDVTKSINETQSEQNRCAMACQGCGAFSVYSKKAVTGLSQDSIVKVRPITNFKYGLSPNNCL